MQLALVDETSISPWRQVDKADPRGAALADRHYSRQTVGDPQYMPPGRTLVMIVDDGQGRAVWGVCENDDIVGTRRFRCTIFRNESEYVSSDLIRHATGATLQRWKRRGWCPPPLETEVDPAKVRGKKDPGWCFLKAGWLYVRDIGGSHGRPVRRVFRAPPLLINAPPRGPRLRSELAEADR